MVRAFTVPGEPKGKGRPRFNPMNPAAHPRTPEATLVYENLIGWEYRRQCKGSFPEKVPVMMQIKAYYTIPASASKKRKQMMANGEERPTKKPDIDNVVKVYADALNHLAYHDDSQVVSITCEKYYSEEPRVEVILSDTEEEFRKQLQKIPDRLARDVCTYNIAVRYGMVQENREPIKFYFEKMEETVNEERKA